MPEDILDVQASLYGEGEPYKQMEYPCCVPGMCGGHMAGFYLHYDGSWQYGNFIHFYADGIADHVWNRFESMWYDCIYVDIGKLYWFYYRAHCIL